MLRAAIYRDENGFIRALEVWKFISGSETQIWTTYDASTEHYMHPVHQKLTLIQFASVIVNGFVWVLVAVFGRETMETSSESESLGRSRGPGRSRGRRTERSSGSGSDVRAADISQKISTLANTLQVLVFARRDGNVCSQEQVYLSYSHICSDLHSRGLLLDRTPAETWPKWTGCWVSTKATRMTRLRPWHWWDSWLKMITF